MTELTDGAAEENRGDYLYSPAPTGEMLPDYPDSDSPEDIRKRKMANWDVAYVVNAREFVRERLGAAIQACGGQQRFEELWITDRVDRDVVKAFIELNVL